MGSKHSTTELHPRKPYEIIASRMVVINDVSGGYLELQSVTVRLSGGRIRPYLFEALHLAVVVAVAQRISAKLLILVRLFVSMKPS